MEWGLCFSWFFTIPCLAACICFLWAWIHVCLLLSLFPDSHWKSWTFVDQWPRVAWRIVGWELCVGRVYVRAVHLAPDRLHPITGSGVSGQRSNLRQTDKEKAAQRPGRKNTALLGQNKVTETELQDKSLSLEVKIYHESKIRNVSA